MTLTITRIIPALVFSGLIGFYYYRAWGLEHGNDFSARDRLFGLDRKDKKVFIFYPLVLPVGLIALFAAFVCIVGWKDALNRFFQISVDLMLTMSLYYVALFILIPVLRRHISARACATAWLFPALLYYIGYNFTMTSPRVVLYCPKRMLDLILPIWLVGFLLVFAAAVLTHLRFRRQVLRTASDECDEDVCALWQKEAAALGLLTPIRLVRCPIATTPFSMGNSRRTRITVLPQQHYSDQELRLIFRHELHHIQRNDADSKLFFAFICALFWFHPLVWLALREAGRDLELSCDEIVLEHANDTDRKLYADLLLNTAGERRGFTTCMSADASSLRYRLRHVMKKRTCRVGTGILMLLLFTCLMTHGVFAVSVERMTLGEALRSEAFFAGEPDYGLIETGGEVYHTNDNLSPEGRKTLFAYVNAISVERLSGARYISVPEQPPRLYFSDSDMRRGVWLCDGMAAVYDFDTDRSVVYYIREEIDWEKIEACFK